ncbi:hypothetical protein ACROYT_G027951 [Oculina patagonica]
MNQAHIRFFTVIMASGMYKTGLGISICGGTDNPHIDNDFGIYITHIFKGGAAAEDGRLCVGDCIVAVNGVSTVNVSLQQAVEAFKAASMVVTLTLKREKPKPVTGKQHTEEIRVILTKGREDHNALHWAPMVEPHFQQTRMLCAVVEPRFQWTIMLYDVVEPRFQWTRMHSALVEPHFEPSTTTRTDWTVILVLTSVFDATVSRGCA